MNKKLILSIIAGVLALVLIIVGVVLIVKHRNKDVDVSDLADLPPVKRGIITFEDQESRSGKTVRIPIIVKKNPGMWGSQLTLTFDNENLEFVSISNGDIFDECEVNAEEDKINILVNNQAIENSKKNGIIATITFNVGEKTAPGDYKITIDESTNFCNIKGALVMPEFEVGTITVK